MKKSMWVCEGWGWGLIGWGKKWVGGDLVDLEMKYEV